jgi:hypothetical protein
VYKKEDLIVGFFLSISNIEDIMKVCLQLYANISNNGYIKYPPHIYQTKSYWTAETKECPFLFHNEIIHQTWYSNWHKYFAYIYSLKIIYIYSPSLSDRLPMRNTEFLQSVPK